MDKSSYQECKKAKLLADPRNPQDILVEIDGLKHVSEADKAAIRQAGLRSNMAIYRCRDITVDRSMVRAFASMFGLTRLDHHLCANADGVSELSVATEGVRTGYVPYSSRSLSWHTDGYYNVKQRQINAVILHCVQNAETGGENALLDPEIAYIYMRDQDPRFIEAFEHPECMTIPANMGIADEIRPEVSGPVFSYGVRGEIHMRFSARKKNIQWRDDDLTRAARDCLSGLLADENGPVFRYHLQPGEGIISNNVLHNRTVFSDGPGHKRFVYRARFFDRIGTS